MKSECFVSLLICLISVTSRDTGTGTYVPYHQMEDRVSQLERYWKELNALPANYQLFERMREKDAKPRPVAEMWLNMKLSKTVDANTQGISKVRCICHHF